MNCETENYERRAAIMKAMAHPVRLQILELLRAGSLCAGRANERLSVSQPNLSQHLKRLREAGIIDMVAYGTKHCYYIAMPDAVNAVLDATENPRREVISAEEIEKHLQGNCSADINDDTVPACVVSGR